MTVTTAGRRPTAQPQPQHQRRQQKGAAVDGEGAVRAQPGDQQAADAPFAAATCAAWRARNSGTTSTER